MIIGREIEYIRGLEKAQNVRIIIDKEGGKVEVVENKSECELAKKAIESMINNQKVLEPLGKFYVPAQLLERMALMWRGSNRKERRPCLPSAKDGRPDIWVRGSSVEDISAAKNEIIRHFALFVFLAVDEGDFESIIGLEGETVRRLVCKVVNIYLKDGNAKITERKIRTEGAREAIISIISDDRELIINAEGF